MYIFAVDEENMYESNQKKKMFGKLQNDQKSEKKYSIFESNAEGKTLFAKKSSFIHNILFLIHHHRVLNTFSEQFVSKY